MFDARENLAELGRDFLPYNTPKPNDQIQAHDKRKYNTELEHFLEANFRTYNNSII